VAVVRSAFDQDFVPRREDNSNGIAHALRISVLLYLTLVFEKGRCGPHLMSSLPGTIP
jgi:hypothetical protein